MSKPLPNKSSRLRNTGGARVFDTLFLCPTCGGTRPKRSLLLCRSCWGRLPEYIQLEAQKAARSDRSSIVVGEMAAKVIASVCIQKSAELRKAA